MQAPVQGLDAVGQAAQAGAVQRIGSSDPVVGDLDHGVAVQPCHADADRGCLRVLRHVGQRLRDDVVGGSLDGRRQALLRGEHLDREGRPAGESLERSRKSTV